MVASLLLVGLDSNIVNGIEAEAGHVASAAEAFASLSRRPWDVVLVGRVADSPAEALVADLARRYPSTPVLWITDSATGRAHASAWEIIPTAEAARALAGALARAAEVARLRREVARLGAERDDRPQRSDVTRAFEQGSIHEMERLMIMERLARMNQNRTHSAASLDISVRTLRNKLREYREANPAAAPAEVR